jgi:hypothetical protein
MKYKTLFINARGDSSKIEMPIIPRVNDRVMIFGTMQSVSNVMLMPSMAFNDIPSDIDAMVTLEG